MSKQFLPLVLFLFLSFVGCSGRDLDKAVVKGKVTYAGQPVPSGQIRFYPIEGTKGPVSGAKITNGLYIADGKGGVPIGKHRVKIRAYRPNPNATPEEAREGAYIQYLPRKYNSDSSLEIEVTGSGTVTQNFDLLE